MTWRAEDPQGNEAAKVKYDVVPYTRGQGLDLGCGPFKAFPHFIGVDNGHHARMFGWPGRPDVHVDSADNLKPFASSSLDFVFSSHLLEHMADTRKALKEWWRVIRPGGYLVLYLPDDDLYPKVGEPGANPDHKADLNRNKVIETMKEVGTWDLVVSEQRATDNGEGAAGNEYSFLQVFRKTTNGRMTFSCQEPKPTRTACIVRYGGIGDLLQAATVAPGLKAQGYHVTMMTTPNGEGILANNPHIDAFIVQDTDQVPNGELGAYWEVWAKKFDHFINLCESIEGGLLGLPERGIIHRWPLAARQKLLGSVSYYERTADIADVPHKFAPAFFPTKDETEWASKQRLAMPGEHVVMVSLAGSSIHKAYPYSDVVVGALLDDDPDVTLVLVGDEGCKLLEEAVLAGILQRRGASEQLVNDALASDGIAGLENLILHHYKRQRVICQSGKWSVRQSLAFLAECAVVVGPETGVLNAAAFMPIGKVVMLSHSSPENLCKHWKNTTALMAGADCQPCHQMHYTRQYCPEHKETSASMCMGLLEPAEVVNSIKSRLPKVLLHAVK